MMVVAKVSTGVSIPKVVQLYLIAKMKEEGIMIDFNSKSGAIISTRQIRQSAAKL